MTETLSAVALAVSLVSLVTALVTLRRVSMDAKRVTSTRPGGRLSSPERPEDAKRATSMPGVRLSSLEYVEVGASRSDVRRLAGEPDETAGDEWIYYLDPHCGWRVRFDPAGRVAQVHDWER